MKKVLFLFFAIPQLIFAQSIIREYRINDTLFRPQGFQAFCKLSNGDLLTTSDIWDTVAFPYHHSSVALIRMDSTGNLIWSKMIPQNLTHNYSYDAAADSSGCYLLNSGNSYTSIIHGDTSGNPTWMRHITNSPSGYSTWASICHAAPRGGCIVAGSHVNNSDDMLWVMKFDTAGNTVFSKGYAWAGYGIRAEYSGMEITADGGMVFPFDVRQNSQYSGVGLLKLDSIGNLQWIHSYFDSLNRSPLTIKLLPDGGFIIGGIIFADLIWPNSSPYVFLLRTDEFGNQIWCKYYDQSCEYAGPMKRQSLILTKNGNLLYGFTFRQSNNYCNAGELFECDTSGQLISAVQIGGIYSDSIFISQLIQSGGKIIASGGRATKVNVSNTYLPLWHPVTIMFDSLENSFCNKVNPVVNTFSRPLMTNQPIITSAPGPTAFNMTLVTLQPFQFQMDACLPTGIENPSIENQGDISIYPNPSSADVTVNVHFTNVNTCQMYLYDVRGKLLQTNSIQNNNSFTLERKDRAVGIYFIRIVADGQQVYAGKIVFSN